MFYPRLHRIVSEGPSLVIIEMYGYIFCQRCMMVQLSNGLDRFVCKLTIYYCFFL
jgi:hypothetical protein